MPDFFRAADLDRITAAGRFTLDPSDAARFARELERIAARHVSGAGVDRDDPFDRLLAELTGRVRRLQEILDPSTPEGGALRHHLQGAEDRPAVDVPGAAPEAHHLALLREIRRAEAALQTLRRRAERLQARTREDAAMDYVVGELAVVWTNWQGAEPPTSISARGRAGGPFIAFVDAFLDALSSARRPSDDRPLDRTVTGDESRSAEAIRARYRRSLDARREDRATDR